MSDLPPLLYLSMDGLAQGVGASQVLPYVERLGRLGLDITVISFEVDGDRSGAAARLAASGVRWEPHSFGRHGAAGGVQRVAALARRARRAPLVHARSDLAAAAALIGRPDAWVWDVRSFWADQRIELGMLRRGSPEERVLRLIERRAARKANAVITLAAAAIPVLEERHGHDIAGRAHVIPTCVDLDRFPLAPLTTHPIEILLSGSLNRYYDVDAMLRFVEDVRRHRPANLTVLTPTSTPWDEQFERAGARRRTATPAEVPEHVRSSTVGLSICRADAGVSLRAAMPTKIAEFLAMGRPIVVNRGLGDMDALVLEARCGVVVESGTPDDLARAAKDLVDLVDDPDLPARCRHVAEDHFSVDRAVARLIDVYRDVTD